MYHYVDYKPDTSPSYSLCMHHNDRTSAYPSILVLTFSLYLLAYSQSYNPYPKWSQVEAFEPPKSIDLYYPGKTGRRGWE